MTVDAIADLSHYQTSVDLAAMKAGGIAAVILKASQGTTFTDPTFAARAAAAQMAGLLVGAYHYFDHGADPTAQADYFLGIANAAGVSVLAIDFEPTTAGAGESNAAVMCQAIQSRTGHWPLLYTGRWAVNPVNSILSNCPLWVAEWTTASTPNLPSGWSTWLLWQFESALNAVPGIVGQSQRSRFNGTLTDLETWWTGQAPPSPSVPVTEIDISATATDNTGGTWTFSGKLTRSAVLAGAMALGGGAGYVAHQEPSVALPPRASVEVPITSVTSGTEDTWRAWETCRKAFSITVPRPFLEEKSG